MELIYANNNSKAKCKRCGSRKLACSKKGFGVAKAAAGFSLAGPIGLAAGCINSAKIKVVCLKCGYQWEVNQNEVELYKEPEIYLE